jgi:dTDP-4-dehydrorhamnose reductase
MRILITGARGQLGQALRSVLLGQDVLALDRQHLDITDRGAVLQTVTSARPDWVVNAAAFTDVDAAESAPEQAFAVNAAAPGYLGEAAMKVGAGLLQVSTDYVFDGGSSRPYTEDDAPRPVNVYGASKLEGEARALQATPRACVIRTAWLYGSGRNFVSAILAAAEQGRPLRVVNDQVGSPTSALDLAGAIKGALEAGLSGLFHVTNAGSCSRYEFALAIVGNGAEVIPVSSGDMPRPAPRPANSALRSVRWGQTGLPGLRPWPDALDAFLKAAPRPRMLESS